MTEEKNYTEAEWHKKIAVECFNKAWDLMEKENRTKEEDEEMISLTITSRFHWGKIGTPLHFQRGEWQIARVYTILGRKEPALHHAKLCLKLTVDN
ncbi:MAG: hypothetical protein ACFFBD_12120, partial [Candidatus Hodarchaeota archaeon]